MARPSSASNPLARSGRFLLDLLLPPQCPCCDTPVASPADLCPACLAATRFAADPCCASCAAPIDPLVSGRTCLACAVTPPAYTRTRAALRYDDQSRRLVLPLKYNDRPELALALTPFMARAGAALLRDADILVPIPLHPARLRTRRYNQAALLARALSRHASRPALLDALQRTRNTAPLHDKSRNARIAELTDAFQPNPRRLTEFTGWKILLIDDILTTGATAETCARIALAAGAAQVDLLVAARAAPD